MPSSLALFIDPARLDIPDIDGVREPVVVWKIATKLFDLATLAGNTVRMSRDNAEHPTPRDIEKRANQFAPDICVRLSLAWSANPYDNGARVYVAGAKHAPSSLISTAASIAEATRGQLRMVPISRIFSKTPIEKTLRTCGAARTIIITCGYISSRVDRERIGTDAGQAAIATEILEGLMRSAAARVA